MLIGQSAFAHAGPPDGSLGRGVPCVLLLVSAGHDEQLGEQLPGRLLGQLLASIAVPRVDALQRPGQRFKEAIQGRVLPGVRMRSKIPDHEVDEGNRVLAGRNTRRVDIRGSADLVHGDWSSTRSCPRDECAQDEGCYRLGSDRDRKSTRLNSSHVRISYAVFCLKKKKKTLIANFILKKKNIAPR